MIMTAHGPRTSSRKAFSLVEVLVVVAIIGILAAASLAVVGGSQRESILQVRDQRNAQEVVNLVTSATAAGADVIEPDDIRSTINNLIEGRQPKRGNFAGRVFRLGGLSEEEITGAMKYLSWQGDELIYLHEGGATPRLPDQ